MPVCVVLNLIITGIPSILFWIVYDSTIDCSFKPYYNWNTFNTDRVMFWIGAAIRGFKPYYNWNTFNTISKEELL